MTATESSAWNDRLRKVMPWGSSTISKAPRFLPEEPEVIVRGQGCRVWDDRGREFIDFRNSLGPITLGYRFPAVDEAIRAQLESGIIFGHPHPLECEVAELLCEVIPCAEQARFLKTGGEALAAVIRLARGHTGREHVIQIGYNGWLNGVAATGQVLPGQTVASGPPGVPGPLAALHHACGWNEAERLRELFEQYDGQVAAVVIAADYSDMPAGREFYPLARELTSRHGSALIYDEIVTGFRIATGGVQEHFGVTPDLAVFAKGIANGMPLSVYAGGREWMKDLDRVFVTSTYGGETLSLAAAKAAIGTYRRENVIEHLWRRGEELSAGANEVFARHDLPIDLKGMPPCQAFNFRANGQDGNDLPERFFRAAYRNGLSFYNVVYTNFSLQAEDVAEAIGRLDSACRELASA